MDGYFKVYGWTAMPPVADRDPEAAYFIRTATGFKLLMVANTTGKEIVELDLTDKEDVANKVTNLNSPDNVTYPTTKAVNDAVDASNSLKYKGQIPAGADLNSYSEEGNYSCQNPNVASVLNTPLSLPTGVGFNLIIIRGVYNASYPTQFITTTNFTTADQSLTGMWMRTSTYNGTGWGNWVRMADRDWVISRNFLTAETDPVYTADKPTILLQKNATPTQDLSNPPLAIGYLSNSWSLTNAPSWWPGTSGVFASFVTTNGRFFSIAAPQISGSRPEISWGISGTNFSGWEKLAFMEDIPAAQTLSISGQTLGISGGNSVTLPTAPGTDLGTSTASGTITSTTGTSATLTSLRSLPLGSTDDAFLVRPVGLWNYNKATTNTGFPDSSYGGGITYVRNNNSNSGRWDLYSYNGSADLWFSAGGSAFKKIAAKSDIPSNNNQLTNGAGYITASALPTVGNGILTIKMNGSTVGTFSANATSAATIDLGNIGNEIEDADQNYAGTTGDYDGFTTRGGFATGITDIDYYGSYTVKDIDHTVLFSGLTGTGAYCYLPNPLHTPKGRILIISNLSTSYEMTLNGQWSTGLGNKGLPKGTTFYLQNFGDQWVILINASNA